MDENFIRKRIAQLRLHKGVSEYQMSYDLGHSRGYVYNISSGKALPPMKEFLAICDYFEIYGRKTRKNRPFVIGFVIKQAKKDARSSK